jgi:hypothetical protein
VMLTGLHREIVSGFKKKKNRDFVAVVERHEVLFDSETVRIALVPPVPTPLMN